MDIDILLAEILESQDDWNVTTTDTAFIIDPRMDSDHEAGQNTE